MSEKIEEYKKLNEKDGTRTEREKLLKAMDNKEIDELIKSTSNIQAKNYLSKFKK